MPLTLEDVMPPGLERCVSFEHCMLDNLRTAVLLFDRELRLVALNPAAEALLDLSATKVRQRMASKLFPGVALFTGALTQVVTEGQALTEREMQIRLPSGKDITVDCTVTPLKEPNQANGVLLELTDLDPQRRIAREEKLLSQSATAATLVRRLAHEIRNPLGGLRGAAQLLDGELLEPALKEYTDVIIREADRLQNLVDRMLGPRTVPQVRRANVHEVTERVRALIQAEAPEGIRMLRDYDPSVPDVEVDPELLIQATLNVVRNAVQALNSRGGDITIRTRVHRQFTIGHQRHRLAVSIEVRDTGPGVPEELREILFYPMVTGRPEGTGLGLSIAQSLVTRQGGRIEYTSGTGETTFRISLPVEEPK